ncbi:MAG: C40 family peptidase, partial [Acidobacteria bacterium]|nr:C40 family peptidase [Acidobacteriota bacterium]
TVIFALLLAATALVTAESFEERLLREIELFQGTPYVWGGEDDGGTDCSGAATSGGTRWPFRSGYVDGVTVPETLSVPPEGPRTSQGRSAP